jgi:nitrite reductase/ring-hydroxylating ferredoxin subunit
VNTSDGFVRVARSADLAAGEGLDSQICDVRLGDETVLVGRLKDGQLVAFASSCPHETTDLHQATFVDGMVRCPRHNYMYDPHTGENVVPARVARRENLWKLHPSYLPTHAVMERDGWVWVKAAPNPAPTSWDPDAEKRPAAAAEHARSGSAPEEPAADRPTVEVPAKHLRVRLGKEFELRLPLGSAPAHTWTIDPPVEILTVVAQGLDPAPPPRQRVRIAARAVGCGTLRCTFGRPWDVKPEEVRTYVVEVVLA